MLVEWDCVDPRVVDFWNDLTDDGKRFWREECEVSDGKQALVYLCGVFCRAMQLSLSYESSEVLEEDIVLPACTKVLDCLRHPPAKSAFVNKPKTLAIVELACQRIEGGSSQAFNQEGVEIGHKFSRKARNNMQYPAAWVVAALWERMFLRALVEGARMRVYESTNDEGSYQTSIVLYFVFHAIPHAFPFP